MYHRTFENDLSFTTCPTSKCSLSKAIPPLCYLFFPLWFFKINFSIANTQSHTSVRFQPHQTLPLFSSLDETPFHVGSIEVLMDSPSFCLLLAHPAVSDALSALLSQFADASFSPFPRFKIEFDGLLARILRFSLCAAINLRRFWPLWPTHPLPLTEIPAFFSSPNPDHVHRITLPSFPRGKSAIPYRPAFISRQISRFLAIDSQKKPRKGKQWMKLPSSRMKLPPIRWNSHPKRFFPGSPVSRFPRGFPALPSRGNLRLAGDSISWFPDGRFPRFGRPSRRPMRWS